MEGRKGGRERRGWTRIRIDDVQQCYRCVRQLQWNLREAYKARGDASRVSEIYLNRGGTSTANAVYFARFTFNFLVLDD